LLRITSFRLDVGPVCFDACVRETNILTTAPALAQQTKIFIIYFRSGIAYTYSYIIYFENQCGNKHVAEMRCREYTMYTIMSSNYFYYYHCHFYCFPLRYYTRLQYESFDDDHRSSRACVCFLNSTRANNIGRGPLIDTQVFLMRLLL